MKLVPDNQGCYFILQEESFEAWSERCSGGCTVHLKGELDTEVSSRFLKAMESYLSNQEAGHSVVLDAAQLRYISSTAAGAFATLAMNFRAKGGKFQIIGLNGNPAGVLQLLGFDSFLTNE